MEEFHQHGIFSIPFPTQSEIKAETLTTVHYSDAIRLILIHKYGGWYSDLDMMFLKPINHLENVLSSDHADDVKVSNAIFHNSKGNSLQILYLQIINYWKLKVTFSWRNVLQSLPILSMELGPAAVQFCFRKLWMQFAICNIIQNLH